MELEADFQATYGLDLRKQCWGAEAVGVRRLSSLISGLLRRSDTAVSRKHFFTGREWGSQHELLATIIEQLDRLARIEIQVNSKPGSNAPSPLVYPRPYKPAPPKQSSKQEMKAFFGGAVKVVPKEQ